MGSDPLEGPRQKWCWPQGRRGVMGRERQRLRGTKEEGRERGSSVGGAPPRPVHFRGPIFFTGSPGCTAVPEGPWNMWVRGQWGAPHRCPWLRQGAQGLLMDFHSLGSWDLKVVCAESNLTDTLTSPLLAPPPAACGLLLSITLQPPVLSLSLWVSFFLWVFAVSVLCVSLSGSLSPTHPPPLDQVLRCAWSGLDPWGSESTSEEAGQSQG